MNCALILAIPLLFIAGCTCSRPVHEVESVRFFCPKEKHYSFVNGVNVSFEDADLSAQMLSSSTGKPFALTYNFSEGALEDVGQALKQKLGEFDGPGEVFFRETLVSLANGLHGKKETYSADELSEINKAAEALGDKEGVIVAHSQGNLFANLICEKSGDRAQIVHLANPSSVISPCAHTHLTFRNDPVIQVIDELARKSFNKALAPIRPNEFFEKGRTVSEAQIRFIVAGLRDLIDGGKWGEAGAAAVSELFFNHEFISYLKRDDSTSAKIKKAIAHLSPKDPGKVIPFIVSLNSAIRDSSSIKSSWGHLPSQGAKLTCKQIAESPRGFFLAVPGTLSGAGRIVIKSEKISSTLKPEPGSLLTAATVDPIDNRGNYIIKAASGTEVAKRFVGLDGK
nr:hypothetical protein BdHM001_34770 [Bdellovibrio sp. HM001]